MKILLTCLLAIFALARTGAAQTTRPVDGIEHVLIISVDGMRPDVMLRATTPNMTTLWKTGAFTFWAKTTPAAITLPSHVSMLTGVTPETHGVLWNADLPLSTPVYPASPTLFQLAHQAHLTTALAAGKSKIGVLAVPGTVDWKYLPDSPKAEDDDVVNHAEPIIRFHKPHLMFIHFPSSDNVGHAKGFGSEAHLKSIEHVDACIGRLLKALDDTDTRSSTLIILTADHGGAGRTHGPEDPRSRSIPWILNGPGVRKGLDLTLMGGESNINTYDTFSTAAAVLSIKVKHLVDGRFVREAFENQELMLSNYRPNMAPTTQP